MDLYSDEESSSFFTIYEPPELGAEVLIGPATEGTLELAADEFMLENSPLCPTEERSNMMVSSPCGDDIGKEITSEPATIMSTVPGTSTTSDTLSMQQEILKMLYSSIPTSYIVRTEETSGLSTTLPYYGETSQLQTQPVAHPKRALKRKFSEILGKSEEFADGKKQFNQPSLSVETSSQTVFSPFLLLPLLPYLDNETTTEDIKKSEQKKKIKITKTLAPKYSETQSTAIEDVPFTSINLLSTPLLPVSPSVSLVLGNVCKPESEISISLSSFPQIGSENVLQRTLSIQIPQTGFSTLPRTLKNVSQTINKITPRRHPLSCCVSGVPMPSTPLLGSFGQWQSRPVTPQLCVLPRFLVDQSLLQPSLRKLLPNVQLHPSLPQIQPTLLSYSPKENEREDIFSLPLILSPLPSTKIHSLHHTTDISLPSQAITLLQLNSLPLIEDVDDMIIITTEGQRTSITMSPSTDDVANPQYFSHEWVSEGPNVYFYNFFSEPVMQNLSPSPPLNDFSNNIILPALPIPESDVSPQNYANQVITTVPLPSKPAMSNSVVLRVPFYEDISSASSDEAEDTPVIYVPPLLSQVVYENILMQLSLL